MYKVLFADDEILTREAIAKNTPWEEAGFQLIGTAENGKQAIAMIEKEVPELVITDICMPLVDGIELAKHIQLHYPETKVMIISGYDEFDYAKQALKYGVAEYILKPITSVELKDELLKIREKLEKENNKKEHVEKIQKAYEKNIPLMKEHYLNRLMEGNSSRKDIKEQLVHLGIQLQGKAQAVVFVIQEDATEFFKEYPNLTDELILFSILNITNEIIENYDNAIAFQNVNDRCVIVIAAENEKLLQQFIALVGNEIIEAMSLYMKTKVSIVVGETVEGPEQWQKSYDNAKHAEELKFLLDDYEYIYGNDFIIKKEQDRIQTNLWTEKFVMLIKTIQKEELKKEVDELFFEFRHSVLERKFISMYVQSIVLTILITLEESEIDLGTDYELENTFVNHLQEFKHLSDIKEQFVNFCTELMDGIAGKRESTIQKQAILALDYIEKNYANEKMSLNLVCAYLSVSVSYFSTIFKAYTGETFVEVLTKVRIEKAKKLLETSNLKNYEVACEVGYSDPHYFSSTFKKIVGKTPTEYAKGLR